MRIFAISDIHVDYGENMEWVNNLSNTEFKNDVLILAGDVAGDLSYLSATLSELRSKFQEMFFVPGNHDVWVKYSKSNEPSMTSNAKLAEVLKLCQEYGVKTVPSRVGAGNEAVWIVPMFSWYHAEFDTEPDVVDFKIPPVDSVMADFALCKWNPAMALGSGVVEFFDKLNDEALSASGLSYEQIRAEGLPIISFSHFVPRLELMPEKRFLYYPNLPKGAGSTLLRARIEKLRPDVHVFGHTHFGWDSTLDGIRYIQAALSYPEERKRRMPTVSIGNISDSPVLIFDSSEQQNGATGFVDRYFCKWSDYYDKNARDPTNLELASWVAGRYPSSS